MLKDMKPIRPGLARAGKIRLGYVVKICPNAKCAVRFKAKLGQCPECGQKIDPKDRKGTYPVGTEYFVLDDAPPQLASVQRQLAQPTNVFGLPARIDEADDGVYDDEPADEPADEPLIIEQAVSVEPPPVETAQTSDRPYDPDTIRRKINEFVETCKVKRIHHDPETGDPFPVKMHPFGEKTANLLAAKWQEALKGQVDDPKAAYKATLGWLFFGVESANELSAAEAAAMFKLLFNGKSTELGFDHPVLDVAKAELLRAYEAAKDEGE